MADGFVARLVRGVWRARCADDWSALAPADHDELMSAQIGDRFHAKQGRSIARWTLDRNDRRLVVYLKRHFHGSRWAGCLATLFPRSTWSPAWHEAEHLEWAAAHGFQVPRVCAVGEKVGPFGQLQSYLALEELAGMIALHEAIPAAARVMPAWTFQDWKRGLIGALAKIVARLHRLRHYHKDLYLCHFFISERLTQKAPADWNSNLAVIDLHRLGHHRYSAAWWRLKDLAQLLYSSDIVGITARDRLRFARHYAGSSRKSLTWRLTRWAVGVRWRNYQRHNAERKLNRAA
jgi:Lipopolysaccharide kinase (Kdo/WaaP) family